MEYSESKTEKFVFDIIFLELAWHQPQTMCIVTLMQLSHVDENKKIKLNCPIFKIQHRIYRNVSIFYTSPTVSPNFHGIHHYIVIL